MLLATTQELVACITDSSADGMRGLDVTHVHVVFRFLIMAEPASMSSIWVPKIGCLAAQCKRLALRSRWLRPIKNFKIVCRSMGK